MREVLAGLEAQQDCKPCKFYRCQSHLSLASLVQCILASHMQCIPLSVHVRLVTCMTALARPDELELMSHAT